MNLKEEAMEKTRKWIEEEYGPRCGSMTYGCPVCEMWICFDRMFANFDSEYSWHKEVNILKDDEAHCRKK